MIQKFRTKLLHSTVLLALFLVACAQGDSTTEDPGALATQFVSESGVAGVAITVGINNELVWSEGFGYADLEQEVPIDPALTRFRVGSTAKSMTAMALGQLHEAGLLDLDLPIQTYVPDFPQKESPITTRMLAGHLGGIRHYDGSEFLSTTAYTSVSDALVIFENDPVVVPPGSEFSYSTYGYNLISAIIEGASDQEFLTYMSENVFGPTGMSRTGADHVVPIISYRSRYYGLEDGQLVNSPWVDNSNKWAGGGFLSTSEDLVRFGFAHLSDEFLQPDTIEMMWTSQLTTNGEPTGYGIGWGTGTDDSGRRRISHGGGSVGGTTDLRIYPDEGLVIAVITNTSRADLGEFTDRIVEVFLRGN